MNPVQLQALQRYVSAVCWFMLCHEAGQGDIHELLAARAHLEATFGKRLPEHKQPFPDIL